MVGKSSRVFDGGLVSLIFLVFGMAGRAIWFETLLVI